MFTIGLTFTVKFSVKSNTSTFSNIPPRHQPPATVHVWSYALRNMESDPHTSLHSFCVTWSYILFQHHLCLKSLPCLLIHRSSEQSTCDMLDAYESSSIVITDSCRARSFSHAMRTNFYRNLWRVMYCKKHHTNKRAGKYSALYRKQEVFPVTLGFYPAHNLASCFVTSVFLCSFKAKPWQMTSYSTDVLHNLSI